MLLFKAWRESRTRFLISATVIGTFCAVVVLFSEGIQQHPDILPTGFQTAQFNEHIYHFIYGGTAKGVFAMLVLFLGLGGLLRERRLFTAPFTLGLPVSRNQLIGAQILSGLSQIVALALLPLLIVAALSPLVHHSYPLRDSVHFAILWSAGGSLEFGFAFLCSVLLGGEYTALVAAYLVLFAIPLIAMARRLQPYHLNILQTMGEFGTMHWNVDHTLLEPAPLPVVRLSIFLLISATLLATAGRITQRQDF
jgi:hypothetical protein